MNDLDGLELVITAIVAAWGIYQTFVNHRMQQDIERFNRQFNRRVKRLEDALELMRLVDMLSAQFQLLSATDLDSLIPKEIASKVSAGNAELHALALIIEDNALDQSMSDYSKSVTENIVRRTNGEKCTHPAAKAMQVYQRLHELIDEEMSRA